MRMSGGLDALSARDIDELRRRQAQTPAKRYSDQIGSPFTTGRNSQRLNAEQVEQVRLALLSAFRF
jgi:hypothetical protein